MKTKKILFCVLNWGLGHATRSTPLISSLLDEGHDVHIASDGIALDVLSDAFPSITVHRLPAYNVRYAKHRFFGLKLMQQTVQIYKAIAEEHKLVKQLVEQYGFDEIISDNRLGCRTTSCPSTVISHQLTIKGGLAGTLATQVHRFFIRKFNALWIPDDESINLSGELTRWDNNPLPTRWLGVLSRIAKPHKKEDVIYEAAIILSGPEPQRSILETQLLRLLTPKYDSIVLVQGNPNKPIDAPAHVKVIPLASAEEIGFILSRSKRLYCRSGYSTIMDIHGFDLEVTLIPTPGQTEQEYLARYHEKKSGYRYMKQR